MSKVGKLFMLVGALVLFNQHLLQAQTDYKFHTVFIYNFTKYIQWPANAPSGSFVIGVLGNSDIVGPLKEMAASKNVNGSPIQVKVYNQVNEIKDCHMVFLPADRSGDLDALRSKLADQPTLLISEKPGLAKAGSGINFIMSDGRWKFEMNQAATERQKLKVSTELTKFAAQIYTKI